MQRITPYLFFVIAAGAFAMIALDSDQSWQTQEISPLRAVIIVGVTFAGAHLLRVLVTRYFSKKEKDKD